MQRRSVYFQLFISCLSFSHGPTDTTGPSKSEIHDPNDPVFLLFSDLSTVCIISFILQGSISPGLVLLNLLLEVVINLVLLFVIVLNPLIINIEPNFPKPTDNEYRA